MLLAVELVCTFSVGNGFGYFYVICTNETHYM